MKNEQWKPQRAEALSAVNMSASQKESTYHYLKSVTAGLNAYLVEEKGLSRKDRAMLVQMIMQNGRMMKECCAQYGADTVGRRRINQFNQVV